MDTKRWRLLQRLRQETEKLSRSKPNRQKFFGSFLQERTTFLKKRSKKLLSVALRVPA
jgi:hypothetical protein